MIDIENLSDLELDELHSFNPRATRPRNRRLPLAILAIAAVLCETAGRNQIADLEGEPWPARHAIDT